MSWISLNLTVVTPVFNRGAGDVELRTSSILGAARYWLRALASAYVADADMPAFEARVLGGFTDNGAIASPLQVRISKPPQTVRAGAVLSKLRSTQTAGLGYLLGQGLYDTGTKTVSRGFIPTANDVDGPNTARLQIRLREADRLAEATLALDAMWLALCVGGIGARTSRGFGGFEASCGETQAGLPDWFKQSWFCRPPWTDIMRSKGMFAVDQEAVAELVRSIAAAGKVLERPAGPSVFPTIGVKDRSFADVTDFTFGDWSHAASQVSLTYRDFRAYLEPAQGGGNRRKGKHTPEWEALQDQRLNSFPLGLFGLPVNFQGPSGDIFAVNAYDEASSVRVEARRASPIRFRFLPCRDGSGKFVVLTLAFDNPLLGPGQTEFAVKHLTHETEFLQETTTDPSHLKPMLAAWKSFLAGGRLTNPHRPHRPHA